MKRLTSYSASRDENSSWPSAKIRSNTFSGRPVSSSDGHLADQQYCTQGQPNRCGLNQNCHVMGWAGLASRSYYAWQAARDHVDCGAAEDAGE